MLVSSRPIFPTPVKHLGRLRPFSERRRKLRWLPIILTAAYMIFHTLLTLAEAP
jgi:hypothetical protein